MEKRQAQMDEEQAKKAKKKKATEMRRMLKTLNKEADPDAREGGVGEEAERN